MKKFYMKRFKESSIESDAMDFIQEALEFYAEESGERIDISDSSGYLTSDTMFILKYRGKKLAVIISDKVR